jgi:hypothetical protein
VKANVITYLVAVGVVVSFLAYITLRMSRVYSRALDDGQVPPDWSDAGGLRSQLYRRVRSSADGKWKPAFKKIWMGFLVIDLIVIVIVLVA